MKGLRAKIDYALKHNASLYKLFNWVMSTLMRLWGKFLPIDKKLILISSLSRKYNDSPRAMYEYMISRPEYSDFHFVWTLEDMNTEIPGPATKVKADSYDYFRTALKAKYWLSAVNIERSLHFKKKSCVYLNTWHGVPVKYVGNEAKGRSDFDFREIDMFCISGEFEREIMVRAFNLRPEAMLPTGLPRNDTLYHTNDIEISKIKQKLGIPDNKKVILYAPTWRDSVDNGKTYAIEPPIHFDLWKERLGREYVILVRAHGYTNKIVGITFDDVVMDVSAYLNINDLFKVSDILISDYSASMIDYSILERPIVCFAYDHEEYKETRGLYLDLDKEIPSGIKKSEEEVIEHILSMDYESECEKTRKLKMRYNQYGGNATQKCVEALFCDR